MLVRVRDVSVRVGEATPLLFAAGALQFPALANTALVLALLAVLLRPGMGVALLRRPEVALLCAFLAFCTVALAMVWPGDELARDLDAIHRVAGLWWFVPLAVWIGASDRRAMLCLGTVAAVFIAGRLIATDWSAPPWPGGERVRLGFSSINHFAQYSAALFVGLLCLAPRARSLRAGLRVPALAACTVAAALSAYWVVVAGTRGVWLALLVTLVAMAVALGMRCGRRALVTGLAAIGLVVALAGLWLADVPGARLGLGDDSVGLRLTMWRSGLEWWSERPWFGFGPAAVEALIAGEGGVLAAAGFKHLHNVFIDCLVRFGLIGTLLLLGLFACAAVSAWRSWRIGAMRFDLWLALTSVMLLAFLCNQTDLRLFGWDWRNFWALVAALACAPGLARNVTETLPQPRRNMAVTGA